MQPKRKLTLADYQTLAEFRYALRGFLRFSEDAARSAGLASQQHQALLAIKGFAAMGPITIGHLAERLQIRPHSAVELVNRLEASCLVRRSPSPRDHRQVHLKLTIEGEEILERLSASHREQLARMEPQWKRMLEILHQEPPPGAGGTGQE